MITREQAEALINEQIVSTISQDAPKQSVFMQLAKKLSNMTSKQTRIPVLSMLPMAYWVNGDTGFKSTSNAAWDNVWLTAGELAVIVPISEAVLSDASFDIFGEITPRVNEAIGKAVDEAVIFGINRPAEWENDIVTRARQAGNNVPVSAGSNYYDLILSPGGLLSKVEELGFAPNGAVADVRVKAKLRGIKDDSGRPIFKTDMQGATQYALDGVPMYFPANGGFDSKTAQLVVGDWAQAVYAIRQDVTTKILDQGVIQDPLTKEIIYNLAQQDMVALRVVFRMGWALPNPATRMDEGRRGVPFAYLEPETPLTTQTVTFTVKNNAEAPAAIAGATVDLNGSLRKTDDAGKAVFHLRAGHYPVKVKKDGYTAQSDTIDVSDSAISKDVTLISRT